MTKYTVLWVDDEHEGLGGFKELAKDENIKLDAVRSLDEFKDKLTAKYEAYDGIISDARFFKKTNQVTGTENEEALYELNEFIHSIPKKFKLFVYTGQPDLVGGTQFNKMFKDVYEKSKGEERLFSDLKIAADKLPEMQIKKSYSRVFEVFNDHYLPKSSIKDLLKFLDDEIEHDKSSIKMARDFIEDLFRSFAKHEIIPKHFAEWTDEEPYKTVRITQTSKFLSWNSTKEAGNAVEGLILKKSSLPPIVISELIYYLVRITNPASHRSYIDSHLNSVSSDYLYKSIKYALLDVIIGFKSFIDKKPLTNNWSKENLPFIVEEGETYKGKVKSIMPYGAFVSIAKNTDGLLHVSEISWTTTDNVEDVLKEGQEIEVKLISIDHETRKLTLSRKALLPKPEKK